MSETSTSSAGISSWSLLTICFIVLKLCGVINWSWVWVLAPMWIGILLFIVIMLVIGLIALIAASSD